MAGRLILFPVPIAPEQFAAQFSTYNTELLGGCHTFIVEELRTARRFLKMAGYPHPIDNTQFFVLNEHTQEIEIGHYLDPIAKGEDVGLLSEAGLPCVADPGAMITRIAQRQGIEVIPLVGPSSLMLALMASGMNGQNFAFVGYLPVDRNERVRAIKRLEERVRHEHQTQIMIEAPYRNDQLLQAMSECCSPETRICVACDILSPSQSIKTRTAREWKSMLSKKQVESLHKRPTVFLIG